MWQNFRGFCRGIFVVNKQRKQPRIKYGAVLAFDIDEQDALSAF